MSLMRGFVVTGAARLKSEAALSYLPRSFDEADTRQSRLAACLLVD